MPTVSSAVAHASEQAHKHLEREQEHGEGHAHPRASTLAHLRQLSEAGLTEDDEARLKKLEEEEKASQGVQLGQYMRYVKGEVDRETSCLELPMTIVLLFSFSCLAILHLKQDKVFAVEGALRFDIEENANFAWSHNFGHKTIHDVNSIADFWSWMQIGFLPLVVQHSWGYSEDLQAAYDGLNKTHPFQSSSLPGQYGWPTTDKNPRPLNVKIPIRDDYLHYNRIIGGIRMRQERAEASYDLCRVPTVVPEELWKAWLGKPCMPASPKYEMSPEAGDAESFGEPQRVEWLATAKDSLTQLQHKAIDMEDGCQQLDRKGRVGKCLCATCTEGSFTGPWLDERTQRVEIGFITYNAEYGLMSLTTVTLFFSRGGMIHKFIHVQSSWADHFSGSVLDVVPMVMCDAVWLSLLGYVFVNEVKEIIKAIRSSKEYFWRALYEDYLEFWNLVDWISMGFAAFCATMFLMIYLETRTAIAEFEKIAVLDTQTVDRTEFAKVNGDFFSRMEGLSAVERYYRVSFCFYPMAVMMRLFKSFAAQGRLAVVTRTLADAAADIYHFFIVFFSVYLCMAVNGVLIFGQDIEDYADLNRAILTVFRAMFGDWDWSSMQEGTLWMSAMWFWIFVLVMMVILLNFLLAIIMDSYAVVKERSMDEETLMKQIDTIMRRRSMNKAKERVKLGFIYQTYFKDYGDDKELLGEKMYVTPQDVMRKVEGIPFSQAKRTMDAAKNMDAVPEPEYTPEDVKKDLDLVNERSQAIRDAVESIVDKVHKYDSGIGNELDHRTTSGHIGRAVPPRRQIVDTVKKEISHIATSISGVLKEEVEIFHRQHEELETQNKQMLAQMQDTHRVMNNIRAQTDAIKQATHRQASLLRRTRAHSQATRDASGPACGPCMSSSATSAHAKFTR